MNRSMLYNRIYMDEFSEQYILLESFFSFTSKLLQINYYSNEFHIRMGCDKVQFAPHFDRDPNFLAVIHGKKTVILQNYMQANLLQCQMDDKHPYYRQSMLWPADLHSKNNKQLYKDGLGIRIELNPGDILFIPPYGVTILKLILIRFLICGFL